MRSLLKKNEAADNLRPPPALKELSPDFMDFVAACDPAAPPIVVRRPLHVIQAGKEVTHSRFALLQ
jgi:hypothetical protein